MKGCLQVVRLLKGKVLAASGTDAELYDPSTGVWTLTGQLRDSRSGDTMTLMPTGQVAANGAGNSVELYDPSAGVEG